MSASTNPNANPDADRKYDHLLFAGTYGNVVAIDKQSGATVWRTALPKSSYTGTHK